MSPPTIASVPIEAVADSVLEPTDVAVTVFVLRSMFAAPAGTATLAQTSSESPPATDGVVVSAVVQDASKNVMGQPPDADSAYVSAFEPLFAIVRWYGTLVPARPPSRCDAGDSESANGGAIGVTNGEPVAPKPPAAVTVKPSLTIEVTFFFRASAMLTVKCTVALPPAGTDRPVHVTVLSSFLPFPPSDRVPPLSAETNDVLSGTGSVTVTSVAAAFPMFLTVIV